MNIFCRLGLHKGYKENITQSGKERFRVRISTPECVRCGKKVVMSDKGVTDG